VGSGCLQEKLKLARLLQKSETVLIDLRHTHGKRGAQRTKGPTGE